MIGSDSFDDMEWEATFLAKVTAKTLTDGIWYYAWTEQMFDVSGGVYVDASPPGRSGSTTVSRAREINNVEVPSASLPLLVHMNFRSIYQGETLYEFCACGAGGGGPGVPGLITVEESDGSPSFTDISTLQITTGAGTGLTLANPSAGVARVGIDPASISTAGVISTGTQSVAGQKTFTATTYCNSYFISLAGFSVADGPDVYTTLQLDGSGRAILLGINPVNGRQVGWTLDGENNYVELDNDSNGGITWPKIRVRISVGTTEGLNYREGKTGNLLDGSQVTGGLITTIGTTGGGGGLTIGTTPITGTTDGYVLTSSGGVLADEPILTLTSAAGGITVSYP